MEKKLVALVMGSQSDWETLKHCAEMLDTLKIPYDTEIISAHRTPDKLHQFSENAEMQGLEIIIAGAGGAAHLPGMIASKTLLPVLGVPMQSSSLNGLDSLLSIVQMPAGVPVGTLAIGKAGAINAALFAASILGASHPKIREHFKKFREAQTEKVLKNPDPREGAK